MCNLLKESGVELRRRGGDAHSKIKKAARKKAGFNARLNLKGLSPQGYNLPR